MDPVGRRSPSPVFVMDEDIQNEFTKTYEAAKRTLIKCGWISAKEISSLCKVSIDTGNLVMDKIKFEFKNRGTFYQ